MMILALEFSSPRRSVALARREPGSKTAEVLGVASETGPRSSGPLRLVNSVLDQAQIKREAVQSLAVGLGPGSYNGIRSAIALAQGWQLARGIWLAGVSTPECLATQAQAQGWYGQVHIVLDAQRNEFYLATYYLSQQSREIVEPVRMAGLGEIRALRDQVPSIFIGPEVTKWFADGRVLFPEAKTLAGLAKPGTGLSRGEELEPIYLRKTSFVKAPPLRVIPS
jgi:tRNA threonylcarbamoyladenosine biosynthesis protein TsaB